jgi:hypothetical protein
MCVPVLALDSPRYSRVYTRSVVAKADNKKRSGRTGKPLVIYFPPQQANELRSISQKRRVAMASIVRFAVDRLLVDLRSGQFELPLGLGE